jgi:hypothetical protein
MTEADYGKIIHASHGKTLKEATEEAKKKEEKRPGAPQVKVPVMQNPPVERPVVPATDPLTKTSDNKCCGEGGNGKDYCGPCTSVKPATNKTLSESEVASILEDLGYALNVDDFDDAARVEGYVKTGINAYVKKH